MLQKKISLNPGWTADINNNNNNSRMIMWLEKMADDESVTTEEVTPSNNSSNNVSTEQCQEYKVYKRRWYILLVVGILNTSNAMVSSIYRLFLSWLKEKLLLLTSTNICLINDKNHWIIFCCVYWFDNNRKKFSLAFDCFYNGEIVFSLIQLTRNIIFFLAIDCTHAGEFFFFFFK